MKAKVMKLPSSSLAALLLLLAATLVVTAQDIPAGAWAGTWMAGGKTKFPRPPPPAEQLTIPAAGLVAVHVVSSDGKTTDWSYKPQVGAFVPIQGRDNVTVKIIKVNDYRLD